MRLKNLHFVFLVCSNHSLIVLPLSAGVEVELIVNCVNQLPWSLSKRMSSDTNTTALKISLRARTYQLYWSGENSGDNFFLFFSRWKVKTHSWHSQVFETGLWIWSQLQREGNFKQVRKRFQEGEVNMERSVHEDVRPLPLPLAQGQAWTSRYDCHSCAKKDLIKRKSLIH